MTCLQEEYAALQSKYQAIKSQRIQQLETMLGEQSSKVKHSKTQCLSAHKFAVYAVQSLIPAPLQVGLMLCPSVTGYETQGGSTEAGGALEEGS
jgi:hypothetical protein